MLTKTRFATVGVVAVLLVALCNVALAFSAGSHDAQQNTTNIVMGNVTGTYGGEGNVSNSGSGLPSSVEGDYGFHCQGNTCAMQTQAQATRDNILKITVSWLPGDPLNRTVTGTSELKSKKKRQLTTDNGPCPDGAYSPTFNVSCTINLSGAAAGSDGASNSAGGTLGESFAHGSPATDITINQQNPPSPPDPKWSNQTQNPPTTEPWTVDPNSPDSQTKTMSAKASVTFQGTVGEIIVTAGFTYLKATAKLTVNVSAP